MTESFVYKTYKGKEITLPLTDEMREFLIARSKDTLIAECDEVWANLNNRPDEEENEEVEEVESYGQLKKAELWDEVNERNKDREEDDKIQVASGADKATLVAALEQDDDDHPDEDDTSNPDE
jgi:hypothetical protein